MVKKYLSCFLAFFVLVCSSVSAKSILVDVSDDEVAVNDNITLSFTVEEITQMKGIQFDIQYDAESLVLNGTEKGSIFDDALAGGISTDRNGTIKVVVAFESGLDFGGDICSAEFSVKDGKKNVSVKTSGVKVVCEDDEEFEETEIRIVVTDATEDSDDLDDSEETSGDSSSSDNNNQSSTGSRPSQSGSSSGSGGGSLGKDAGKGGATSEDDAVSNDGIEEDEVLFVDSDISVMVPPKSFDDTVGHWAEVSIVSMANAGIVNGVSESEFQPDRNVTRAEFATMTSKVLRLEDVAENGFSDVAEDAWYKDSVLKCVKAGIVKGADGMFRPDDLISREEMAVILYKAKEYLELESTEIESEVSAFADDGEISDWAKAAVVTMSQDGIINGMGNNMFAPHDSATRAQAVIVLEKIMKMM